MKRSFGNVNFLIFILLFPHRFPSIGFHFWTFPRFMLPLFGLFFFPSTHSYSEKPFILMVRNFAIYVYSHCFVCSSIYVFSLKSLPFQWNSKMWSAWNVCHLAMSRLQFSYSNGTENHSLITTCRCARHQSDIKTSQHENSETFNCGKMCPNENNGWRWANIGEEKL